MNYIIGYVLGFLLIPSAIFGMICILGLFLSLFNRNK